MLRTLMSLLSSSLILSSALGESLPTKKLQDWTVVVSPQATVSEKYAAEEFRSLFKGVSGVELALAEKASVAGAIHVGIDSVRSVDPAFSIEDLGDEGLRIRVEPTRILIAGGLPRGTLYGVYEFFERYCGVRFLTRDHTHFPSPPPDSIPCEEFRFAPTFSFRWSYYRENSDAPEFAARMRVNTVTPDDKLGGNTPQSLINHSLFRYVSPDKYGKDHPEYFALVDGVRRLDVGGGGPEPCVTNQAVLDIVSEGVIADLDANPNQRNISVSQNDNDEYCRCATCEAINQAEGTPMGSHLAFVNAVAERVEAKHPKVKVGTLAYWYTRKPPKTIVPRKNIQIQLCSIECCTLHPINDPNCPKNREFFEDLMNWKKISEDIWIWNYNTNFRAYDLPFPNLRVISPNLKFFAENNVHGVFMQANGNGTAGEMSELRNYVISRCLWNPNLEGWSLVEEFCRLHYGKAADRVLEYLTFFHDYVDSKGCHPACFPRYWDLALDPEVTVRMYRMFEAAMAEAENETIRDRVEKASICVYKALIEAGPGMRFQDGVFKPDWPADMGGIGSRYIELCKKHQMTMAGENTPAEEYFDRLKQAEAGIPGERLENSVWRVTVVPERNARMVELYHKPTGRHLFAAMGRKNLGMEMLSGELEESGLSGFKEKETPRFGVGKTAVDMTLRNDLPNGSVYTRKVYFRRDQPEKVFFSSEILHQGNDPTEYQIKVRPEFDIVTDTTDTSVIAAYIKDDEWKQFNEDWDTYTGPKAELLLSAKGGEIAIYNHRDRFGAKVNYKPEQVEQPKLWWEPSWEQANLELWTRRAELKKGEKLAYDYSIECLAEPPR
ncbi:MAG: hypothetical protein GHCLOJNM_00696 [bacterium]|nr:hypothetical protein [bacterium]